MQKFLKEGSEVRSVREQLNFIFLLSITCYSNGVSGLD